MNEKPETNTNDQTATATPLTDLPVNDAQADQVKGGPTSQSKRTVVLKSSFSADSADE